MLDHAGGSALLRLFLRRYSVSRAAMLDHDGSCREVEDTGILCGIDVLGQRAAKEHRSAVQSLRNFQHTLQTSDVTAERGEENCFLLSLGFKENFSQHFSSDRFARRLSRVGCVETLTHKG